MTYPGLRFTLVHSPLYLVCDTCFLGGSGVEAGRWRRERVEEESINRHGTATQRCWVAGVAMAMMTTVGGGDGAARRW